MLMHSPPPSSGPITVLLLSQLPDAQVKKLHQLSSRLRFVEGLTTENLYQTQIVYGPHADFDVNATPNLRWMQCTTVNVSQLMHCSIANTTIPIANVRGAYALACAELTVALVLGLKRRFGLIHEMQLRSFWPDDYEPLKGENCYGVTLGLIGYGSIGRQIARICQAMGMNILACKLHPQVRNDESYCLPNTGDPEGLIPTTIYGPSELHEMLSHSDIVVCSLPQTKRTHQVIGAAEFKAMRPQTYFINVGRGAVVDEQALISQLQAGKLAGAGLDVFSIEPLPKDSPLWGMPNVLICPHVASYTGDQSLLAAGVLHENLSRDLRGDSLLNIVSMNNGY